MTISSHGFWEERGVEVREWGRSESTPRITLSWFTSGCGCLLVPSPLHMPYSHFVLKVFTLKISHKKKNVTLKKKFILFVLFKVMWFARTLLKLYTEKLVTIKNWPQFGSWKEQNTTCYAKCTTCNQILSFKRVGPVYHPNHNFLEQKWNFPNEFWANSSHPFYWGWFTFVGSEYLGF